MMVEYSIDSKVDCAYCGKAATLLQSSADLYHGRDYGPVWFCDCEPAWVGCHKGTWRPLGRLANASLRAAKQAAHAAFDPLWREGGMKRNEAYRWLSQQLGIRREDCHIGMFDEAICARVVEICQRFGRGVRSG